MKLYLRRQTISTTKGMLSKRTEISFSLYARLDVDRDEMALIQEFALGAEIVGSHQAAIPGVKDQLTVDDYNAAEIIPGKDIPCVSFFNMMGLERDLLRGCKAFAEVVEHARTVRQNHEAVHDLSDVRQAAQAAA